MHFAWASRENVAIKGFFKQETKSEKWSSVLCCDQKKIDLKEHAPDDLLIVPRTHFGSNSVIIPYIHCPGEIFDTNKNQSAEWLYLYVRYHMVLFGAPIFYPIILYFVFVIVMFSRNTVFHIWCNMCWYLVAHTWFLQGQSLLGCHNLSISLLRQPKGFCAFLRCQDQFSSCESKFRIFSLTMKWSVSFGDETENI